MDKNFIARQMNVAMQKFVVSLNLNEDESMEVADLYPSWESRLESKKPALVDEIFKYGVNTDNETQLYRVIQEHTPQANWTPDSAASLYKKIGFTDEGVSIWTQPLGGHDAYMKSDIVSFNGTLYVSTVDGNVWQPGVYGWEVKE